MNLKILEKMVLPPTTWNYTECGRNKHKILTYSHNVGCTIDFTDGMCGRCIMTHSLVRRFTSLHTCDKPVVDKTLKI